ncbi:hypothetical protein HU200_059420 [Digitaria exilis]|uniref:Uncharacterized protein n=1 Tax=Digitaria exilis TaxID=1010633 RepID=A0A835AED9_9POAL|nr:hypothetical protein HU200_059420 [Digitaria exilis]
MADLAIGLSKTTVEAVVNKVKSAIKEEAELLQTVQRDLVFITDEFEMMQSFLNSTIADRIMNSNVVRTWVKQVRDLSYDTEDCIESALHLDTKRSFWTLLRRLLVSFKPGGGPLPLDQVVAEIKLLKARVEDVSQRNMRYSLIDSDSSSMRFLPSKSTSKGQEGRRRGGHRWQEPSYKVNEFRLVGRDSEVTKLDDLILKDHMDIPRVVYVWGMAGVGKSVLVKTIYRRWAHEKYAWVNVSYPFQLMDFCRSILFNMLSGAYRVLYREMMAHVDEDMIRHVLDEEARVLLPNCGGHPSVIVALGRYLAHLHTLQRGIHDREWKRLNANMMRELETNPEFESLRGLFAQMRTNFQACPPILKKCIFYLSIFPQSSMIRRRRLVRRWLAEGYSSGTDDHQGGTSLEEGAEKLVDQLAQMGIIRAAAVAGRDSLRMTSWKVNSFLLDYIISHKEEGTLFLPLEVSVLEGNCSLISTGRVGQHLAIGSSWNRDEFMFNSLDLSRLRSLTVAQQWEPFFISNKMRVLRVLDLEGASNNIKNGDLEQIGEKLPRLKFLSLRGCREVSLLPDSLGDLRQLQTLDIRDTCVDALPKSIIKLFKLQYIRAGRGFALPWVDDNGGLATGEPSTPSSRPVGTQLASYLSKSSRAAPNGSAQDGVRLPRGIGKLKALQTLGAVSVVSTTRGNAILAELQHHKQLKKLQLSGINQTNRRSKPPLVLPGYLESLAIRGKVLPRNIRFPGNLMKLSLDVTILSTTPEDIQVMIQAIGKLEKLHTLRLFIKMAVPTRWELQFLRANPDHAGSSAPGQFTELKVFEIGCTSGLCVRFEKEAVKKLEQLKVHHPFGSSLLEFDGLKYPISLEQVCVKGYCDDRLKGHFQDQLADHPKKLTLKLEE